MAIFSRKKKANKRQEIRTQARQSLPTTRYYRPKKQVPETKVAQNTDTETNKKFSISGAINVGILIAVFSLLVFSTTMTTTPDVQLKSSDFTYRPTSEYQQFAGDYLSSNPLQRSKLFFRSQNIESEMLLEFPEITQIDAIVPLGGRDLGIVMRVSEPFATLQSGSEKGVINDDGVLILGDSVNESELLQIRFAQPQESFQQGSRQLTTTELDLLQLLQRELSNLQLSNSNPNGLQISSVLFNVGDGQFEVSLTNAPYFIKLSTYGDASEQVGGVLATLRQLDQQNVLPERYIDVRVPGRVFVL